MKHLPPIGLYMLIACLLLLGVSACASANLLGIPDSEYNALLALYDSTGGSSWTHHDGWLTTSPIWYGVLVSGGHVVRLCEPNNKLSGQVPVQLADLTALQYLNLSNNSITGSVPSQLGNLASLQYLDLSINQLTGKIPTTLYGIACLQYLSLAYNSLSGQLPSQISGLTSLKTLDLHWNSLDGQIPSQIGSLTNLQYIDLSYNEFTGSLPTQLGNDTNLQTVWLQFNSLSGSIPSQLGNLTCLVSLDLGFNRISSQIPMQLGSLTKLESMSLNNNSLTGAIPSQLGSLTQLQYLNLSDNQLSGQIPTQLSAIAPLQSLTIAYNQLTGQIPPQLGSLTNLQYLGLNNNRLSGTIPAELGNLSALQQLQLGGNQLAGQVPASIASLKRLYAGMLSYNALWTTNSQTALFLATVFPGWDNTQTIAPKSAGAQVIDSHTISVSWTPILYSADSGYYEVGYSTSANGPFTFDTANRTPDKKTTSLKLTGLPGASTIYLVVCTVTAGNTHNQSIVTSAPSYVIAADMFAPNASQANGSAVEMDGATVTATFPGFFYIEGSGRTCGMRVAANGWQVSSGNVVDVVGVIKTNATGERYVDAGSVTQRGTGSVAPVALANRALGGGNWNYNSTTGAGRMGVTCGTGLNNVGLLVKTWGRVTAVGQGYVTISDGSGPLKVDTSTLASQPIQGAFVAIVGISSIYPAPGGPVSLLLPRSNADVAAY